MGFIFCGSVPQSGDLAKGAKTGHDRFRGLPDKNEGPLSPFRRSYFDFDGASPPHLKGGPWKRGNRRARHTWPSTRFSEVAREPEGTPRVNERAQSPHRVWRRGGTTTTRTSPGHQTRAPNSKVATRTGRRRAGAESAKKGE